MSSSILKNDGLVGLENDVFVGLKNDVLVGLELENDVLVGLENDVLVGLQNDSLVGLQNDDLDCDGLVMVVNDNCEFIFEGRSYWSYTDYVQARRSRTAGIFANSGMLAARSAIAERRGPPLVQGGRRIPAMIWRYRRCSPNESQVALPGKSAKTTTKALILLNLSGRMYRSAF